MKKVCAVLVLMLFASSAMATYNPPCQTCPPGPQGPQGVKGDTGSPGKDGAPGVNGRNGAEAPLEGTQAALAGAMALSRIDHAKKGGWAAGVGLATFDDGNGAAIGVGKSILSTGKVKEYVIDAGLWVGDGSSTVATGGTVALTLHW